MTPEPIPAGFPTSARRHRLRQLGLLTVSLCASLALAEAVTRLSGLAPDVSSSPAGRYQLSANPQLGYEPVASSPTAGRDPDRLVWGGATNRLGFRDFDWPEAKTPDVERVIVLGDSIAAGMGIASFSDTLPAHLSRELESRRPPAAPRIEVLSFAVPGYNTSQEVETLVSRGLAFAPDAVVVAYCHNDRSHADGQILAALLDRNDPSRGRPWTSHPLLLESALFRTVFWRISPPPETREKSLTKQARQRARETYPQLYGDSVPTAFRRLGQLASDHDFVGLVAVFPLLHDLDRESQVAEHGKVARQARAAGLLPVDLLPAFQDCRSAGVTRLGLDKVHPSPAGQACAATAVADAVTGQLAARRPL